MFKRFDYSLKKKFKIQLEESGEYYRNPLQFEEERSIESCWSILANQSYSIKVIRFRKQIPLLGISIQSEYIPKIRGYYHKIKTVLPDGIIGQTSLLPKDIILEVNGVNLQQFTYDQLSLVLYSLPEYIQIVYARPHSHEESLQCDDVSCRFSVRPSSPNSFNYPTNKMYFEEPVKLIIEAKEKCESGIAFRDINYSPQIVSCTEVSHVTDNKNCYFEQDGRVKPKDCIVKVNKIDVSRYNSQQLKKLIDSKSRKTMVLWVRKWTGLSLNWIMDNGQNSSLTIPTTKPLNNKSRNINQYSSRSVPDLNSKLNNINKIKRKSGLEEDQLDQNEIDNPDIYEQLNSEPREVVITPDDDVSMYLQQRGHRREELRTLIVGFRPNSTLMRKLQTGDEILVVDNFSVRGSRCRLVAEMIIKIHETKSPVYLKVIRTYLLDEFISDWIILDEDTISTSPTTTNTESSDCSSMHLQETRFKETLSRIHNKETGNSYYGIKILNTLRPTITAVEFDKSQIRPGDIIERINDIYVYDKDRDFVLQCIRSSGEVIYLELIRLNNSLANIPEPILQDSVTKYNSDDDPDDFPLPPPPSLEDLESMKISSFNNGKSEKEKQATDTINNHSCPSNDIIYQF